MSYKKATEKYSIVTLNNKHVSRKSTLTSHKTLLMRLSASDKLPQTQVHNSYVRNPELLGKTVLNEQKKKLCKC